MRMIVIVFQKVIWGKWTILVPKIVHCHNSGSAVRIFLNFFTMKRTNRKMKMITMVFTKKKFSEQVDHFGPQNGADPLNSVSALRFFFKKIAE